MKQKPIKQTSLVKTKFNGAEESNSEDHIKSLAETDGHEATVGMGIVMSGGYQSVSLNVSTTVPCTKASVKKAHGKAAELTEEFIASQIEPMKSTLKKLIKEAQRRGG